MAALTPHTRKFIWATGAVPLQTTTVQQYHTATGSKVTAGYLLLQRQQHFAAVDRFELHAALHLTVPHEIQQRLIETTKTDAAGFQQSVLPTLTLRPLQERFDLLTHTIARRHRQRANQFTSCRQGQLQTDQRGAAAYRQPELLIIGLAEVGQLAIDHLDNRGTALGP